MLRAEGLSKAYGALQVFKDVSLHLRAGEAVALVGASGSGKSTLLQLLGTLDRPDAGTIFFEEQPLLSRSAKALALHRNRHLGFVFQFHHLLAEFSALENVAMPALLAGKPKKAALARAENLLAELGLAQRTTHLPAELSGGEQQRVAVARALMNKPKLLLADEPTGNLDETNTGHLFGLLQQLAHADGIALLIATHNLRAAQALDRVLQMAGQTLTEIPASEISHVG
jgi:lipoprotein-releasing system ATP-binding protein